jgi:glucose/arabinose dehydrogenase
MRGLCCALALALVLAVADAGPAAAASPNAVGARLVVGGLAYPAAFTFFPDGRILYGERYTGEIRIYDPASGSDTLFVTIPHVVTNGEQGLLGLAIHPRWPAASYVYAYATRSIHGSLQNQILRIVDAGGTGGKAKVIFASDTVAGSYHDGGHIAFGPDGDLYAVVGEGHDSSNSQDLSNDAGKVLRMRPNGSVPPDNPFPGSLIFTYGLRNSFGFDFDQQTGLLWETENGPECNDEVNVERSGENHAWGPNETCSGNPPQNTNQDGPQPRIMPLTWFTPTIAPTGAAFCVACGLTGADGHLFFGAYNTGEIRDVTLTADRQGIAGLKVAYTNATGVLSMQAGPDGSLYFSDDASIYRLVNA